MTNQPSKTFWNRKHGNNCSSPLTLTQLSNSKRQVLEAALAYFGDVENKTLLDLGCGRGEASLFFASYGAQVLSIDISDIAIRNLSNYCQGNDIHNITPINMSALDVDQLPDVHLVFGSMVLHHIDPFPCFAENLSKILGQKGKGFFWENSARSNLLMWCRHNLVGRLGIPKFSDPEEYPLTPQEIMVLKNHFAVSIVYPDLVFFRLIATYLLKGKGRKVLRALDQFLYQYPKLRSLSYRQYLCLN